MQRLLRPDMGTGVKIRCIHSLDLSWNPLTELGDIPSGFGDFDPLKSDQSGIGLYLEGTDFDEHTFQWLRD